MAYDLVLKDISEEIFSIINLGIICLYEHNKVDGHIGDPAVFVNFAFVGEDGSSRLDKNTLFNRNGQIIH